jgi:hypothetical protein
VPRIQASLYEDSTHIDDRKGEKVQADNALYSQTIHFVYPVPERLNDLNANAAQWARNDAELVRKALNAGGAAVAGVIAKSLNSPKAVTVKNAETFMPQEPYSLEIDGTAYSVSQLKIGPEPGTTFVAPKRFFEQRPTPPAEPGVSNELSVQNPQPATL